jgi:hypothetical protein
MSLKISFNNAFLTTVVYNFSNTSLTTVGEPLLKGSVDFTLRDFPDSQVKVQSHSQDIKVKIIVAQDNNTKICKLE